jgi:aminomethyltransferase
MKRTPLHDCHEALGGRMIEFGGWSMPVQYGPILEEVRQVRERVGLFDLGHMGRVRVLGPDALRYIDRIATNHCERIPQGSIRYALFCRPDGSPIDDLLVYREPESVYLVINAANTDADLEWMAEHLGEADAVIEDLTASTTMLALQGPRSTEVLASVCSPGDIEALGYYKFTTTSVCGVAGTRVSRTGYTGEVGYEIYVANDDARGVWEGLLAADAAVRPIGLGARDTLRLEAGMALYGHEIDPTHNPVEAGLSFAISFSAEKGDWIGREALRAAGAAPTRALVGLTTDGKRVPRQGYGLFQGDEPAGEVCSGAVSPTLDTNIATAYVRPELASAGTRLEMDIRGRRQAVVLCDLPFYSRTRPKS